MRRACRATRLWRLEFGEFLTSCWLVCAEPKEKFSMGVRGHRLGSGLRPRSSLSFVLELRSFLFRSLVTFAAVFSVCMLHLLSFPSFVSCFIYKIIRGIALAAVRWKSTWRGRQVVRLLGSGGGWICLQILGLSDVESERFCCCLGAGNGASAGSGLICYFVFSISFFVGIDVHSRLVTNCEISKMEVWICRK